MVSTFAIVYMITHYVVRTSRSKDFRQDYGRLVELWSLVCPGTPYMACTATATHSIYKEIVSSLEMTNSVRVSHSPYRSNIFYDVKAHSDLENGLSGLLSTRKEKLNTTSCIIVYCLSLNTCSDLYAYFHYELGAASYYPPGSPELSENRLFGMYHASTPQHNKDVISQSLLDPEWSCPN